MNKPKVLIISANTFLGGTEQVLLSQLQHARKIEPVVAFLKPQGPLIEELQKRRVSYWVPSRSLRIRNFYTWKPEMESLAGFCKSQDVSLILSHLSYAQVVGSLISQSLKVPNCWFQHGPVGGWLDWSIQFFPTKKIFYNSQLTLKAHQQMMISGRRPSEVVHIPVEPLEPTTSTAFREKLSLTESDFLFSHIGRLQPWKGQLELLKAFAPFARKERRAHLALVGSADIGSESYEKSLKQFVQSSGLLSQVHFVGFQSGISEILASSDCIVSNSQKPEPFGLTIVEAFQEGLPLICTSQSGAAEVLPVKRTPAQNLSSLLYKEFQKGRRSHQFQTLPNKILATEWVSNFEMKLLELL